MFDCLTVTSTSSEISELSAITIPKMPKPVVTIDFDSRFQHPKYGIFKVVELERRAKRFLILDSDIYCRHLGGKPADIRAKYPPGSIYMLDEASIRRDPNWANKFRTRMDDLAGSVDWSNNWWNPGVTLIDGDLLSELFQIPPWNVNDVLWNTFKKDCQVVKNMPWLNWVINKYHLPVKPLSPLWNCLSPMTSKWGEEAYFWHLVDFEGCPYENKINLLRKLKDKYGSRYPRGVLVTVVMGSEFEEMFKITGARMQEMADVWGMDFHVRRYKGDWPSPSWAKLDYPIAPDGTPYDFMFFVDCDTYFSKQCPNPVDVVEYGKFAAFDSLSLSYMQGGSWTKSLETWCKRMNYDCDLNNMPFYINGGIWFCWYDARHILNVPPVDLDHYFEQHGLNINLWNDPSRLQKLSHHWNYGHLHRKGIVLKGNYIYHLNGLRRDKRMEMLEELRRKVK